VPLSPPQTPYDLTWTRRRAAAVESPRLTAGAMGRHLYIGWCTNLAVGISVVICLADEVLVLVVGEFN
jgi:hypothetical protein